MARLIRLMFRTVQAFDDVMLGWSKTETAKLFAAAMPLSNFFGFHVFQNQILYERERPLRVFVGTRRISSALEWEMTD